MTAAADPPSGPRNTVRVWPGEAYPLGATYDGTGTNFSLFTSVAEGVELCLIETDGTEQCIELTEVDGRWLLSAIRGA